MTKLDHQGRFEIQVSDNLLIATGHGLWNKNTAERYAKAFQESVKSICANPWLQLAKLIDLV